MLLLWPAVACSKSQLTITHAVATGDSDNEVIDVAIGLAFFKMFNQ
jgi:hypothetical protein